MAVKGVEMGMVLILVFVLWNGVAAQSGCTSLLMGLSPCLNFVNGNSSTPSSSCCSQLNDVVQSQPRCLCSLLNGGGSSFGITINQTLALALPGACNVQTPAISQCNAAASGPAASATIPASAPVGSPADFTPGGTSNETPEIPTTPSESDIPSAGAGSKTFPSTDGASSGGSTIKSPLHIAAFLLFIISCAFTATGF
ncbi:non-specific lipid transfer protein GPI-anchored 5-like [Actinidia eriantha]|uniref:non-specific lipid transfer protein GPI-anchored 5-like n=1 Tax=Actinidia eriantha TaxID=165200 RepID=UPI002585D7D3|nr:non-specific lipid transfer protein GPI-anchored 5-like [Actinidia eriantha]